MRCEGFRRRGGAFSIGMPVWEQCENEAKFLVTVTQEGKTKTFPSCEECLNEGIKKGVDFEKIVLLEDN